MKNPFIKPYKITSPYGKRVLNGQTVNHNGVDLVCPDDTVVATDDGIVESSTMIANKNNATWEWGNYVKLRTDNGYEIFYCHLAERKVKKGDRVSKGDVIGIMGNTGYSFGKHLHYEVRKSGKTLNASEYLGILNKVGNATDIKKDDEDIMTKEQILTEIGDEYIKTYADLPEWAKPDMRLLLDAGIINGGTSYETNPDDINMYLSQIKTIIICKRMINR